MIVKVDYEIPGNYKTRLSKIEAIVKEEISRRRKVMNIEEVYEEASEKVIGKNDITVYGCIKCLNYIRIRDKLTFIEETSKGRIKSYFHKGCVL